MVCRLTEQKGVELVLENQAFFARENVKLIVLGGGNPDLEARMREMVAALPEKVAYASLLDEKLSHLVEAGSDFFLMPSLFEPCGLNQMYSQAYGTVPLVTKVGGLVNTVIDIDASPELGTGIMIEPDSESLRVGLARAWALFADAATYGEVQRRGMLSDFGWDQAALAYEAFYASEV
jgi:starch synthase